MFRFATLWRDSVHKLGVLSLLVVAFANVVDAQSGKPKRRPNIVFILADDLGWSDTTLFGTTKFYKTPQIEKLAARGMTFTRAYSASPLCSPTRASILTGLNPARIGITAPTCHQPQVVLKPTPLAQGAPGDKCVALRSVSRLDTRYYTLAEALRDQGYATAHFGKWHLGHEPYSPLEHGFSRDVPHWPGPGPAGSYVAPWKFPDFDPDTPSEHIEDRMAREAVAFMRQHRDKPFFLNYWMFSVHAPFNAKAKLIEKYRGQIDPKSPQRSPTYAAMIESMDDAVGTLLKTLDELGIADNTIIVFASDNGGNMYNEVDGTTPTSNAPLRGGKATMFEGGVRGPCVVVWPSQVKAGTRSDERIQSCDFYPTILEMLQLKPRQGQTFDGISLVPALNGKSLPVRPIFTYFPHQPRVPDWLPPSVSVHHQQWKLIRLFFNGEKGQHRWQLYDLTKDPGEKRNLADAHPQVVARLDKMIEGFLTETKAVQPTPNPRFDPAKYRPQDEGKQRKRQAPRATGPRGTGAVVAGWTALRQCKLRVQAGKLVIQALGGDPYMSFTFPQELPAGKYTVKMTLESNGRGRGQFFWREKGVRPAFHRDRSVSFDMEHDGTEHEYTLTLSAAKRIQAVRFDPGQGRGTIKVSAMVLQDSTGKNVHRWRFGQKDK